MCREIALIGGRSPARNTEGIGRTGVCISFGYRAEANRGMQSAVYVVFYVAWAYEGIKRIKVIVVVDIN
jgi:hypothetical protein